MTQESLIIARGQDVTLEETPEEFGQRLRRRLYRRYSPKKVAFIEHIESVYLKFEAREIDQNEFLAEIKPTIDFYAEMYVRKWSKWRVSRHDFESIFWEHAVRTIQKYRRTENDDFFLLEHLERTFKSRAIDLVRKVTQTKQGRFEHGIASLDSDEKYRYIASEVDVEKEVTDRMIVEDMLSDKSLTTEEQTLLALMYEEPDASDRQLAELMSKDFPKIKYNVQISRMKDSIRRKLSQYNPFTE